MYNEIGFLPKSTENVAIPFYWKSCAFNKLFRCHDIFQGNQLKQINSFKIHVSHNWFLYQRTPGLIFLKARIN